MKKLLYILIPIVIAFGLIAAGCEQQPPCVKSHIEIEHVPEQTRMQTLTGMPWMGRGAPIVHHEPAYDRKIEVCDERAKQ